MKNRIPPSCSLRPLTYQMRPKSMKSQIARILHCPLRSQNPTKKDFRLFEVKKQHHVLHQWCFFSFCNFKAQCCCSSCPNSWSCQVGAPSMSFSSRKPSATPCNAGRGTGTPSWMCRTKYSSKELLEITIFPIGIKCFQKFSQGFTCGGLKQETRV